MNIKLDKKDIKASDVITTEEFSSQVNSWMYDSNKKGLDYLIHTINIVEPGEYNKEIVPVNEKEFIMTKKDGEEISFKLTEGDIEDYPCLSVTKNNTTRNYSCNIEGDIYQILLSSIDRKLANGIVHEHLFNDVDSFNYTNGEDIIYFHIPKKEEKHRPFQFPYHKEFINALNNSEFPKNIKEVYDIFYKYIKDTRETDYSISYASKKDGYSNISVKNNIITSYSRTIDGNTYTIDTTTTPYTLLKNNVELESKESVLKKLTL